MVKKKQIKMPLDEDIETVEENTETDQDLLKKEFENHKPVDMTEEVVDNEILSDTETFDGDIEDYDDDDTKPIEPVNSNNSNNSNNGDTFKIELYKLIEKHNNLGEDLISGILINTIKKLSSDE